MFQIIKVNLLIPLEYDKNDADKITEEERKISKEEIQVFKETKKYDCTEWFHYCCKNKRIERNKQMKTSPLVRDDNYRIDRLEIDAVIRPLTGLQYRESAVYTITKIEQLIKFGKIRILFTQSRLAFLHIEIFAYNMSDDEVRALLYSLSSINSKQPQLTYIRKISKDVSETVQISLKAVINNILNIQSYVPLKLYKEEVSPYYQICLIGSCDEDKKCFFDSVRTLSKRTSTRAIDDVSLYIGKEDYISRYTGDRTACIYGDTDICGEDNLPFLTNVENGLLKTATENYLTVYAYLISLHLLLIENNLHDPDIEYILNATSRFSDEENIQAYFTQCLWDNGWNLDELISSFQQRVHDNILQDGVNEIRETTREHSEKINEISQDITELKSDVKVIANFVLTDLKDFVYQKKRKLQMENLEDEAKEEKISDFAKEVCTHIDEQVSQSGDDTVRLERESLEQLFGEKWHSLMKSSQTSLVSAGVLLRQCANIHIPDFDYSGICICATAALEAELQRVFFDGYIAYLSNKYGKPNKNNMDHIYQNWPEVLLTVPQYQYKNQDVFIKSDRWFTMGILPSLFGEYKSVSDTPEIRRQQAAQARLSRKQMTEYLTEIIDDAYKQSPLEAFYIGVGNNAFLKYEKGCFLWKTETIRESYRNKAAHVDVMSDQEAANCYQSVIRKPEKSDVYVFNAEITGAMLELFTKIDAEKLTQILNSKGRNKQGGVNVNRAEAPSEFRIGQIVKLSQLEVTTGQGLRGIIEGSTLGAAVSKKYLDKIGKNASSYIGKTIDVKLIRWDSNAQKYNVEFAIQ